MNQQKQFQEGKLERRDRDVEAQSFLPNSSVGFSATP